MGPDLLRRHNAICEYQLAQGTPEKIRLTQFALSVSVRDARVLEAANLPKLRRTFTQSYIPHLCIPRSADTGCILEDPTHERTLTLDCPATPGP